jgi:hypothetical protein
MAGVQKLGPCVKLVIVLALVMSASDGAGASRPLVVMRAAAGEQQQQSTNGYGGVLASVKLAVVMRKLWAGPSGCTYDPNNPGRRCP